MEEQIKDILRPHFGHLNFLMKIKRDEISISDIGYLVNLLKDKSIVSNLPKELHNYNSYYTLLKDYYFVKRNYILIRFIKDNITSASKDIFLKVIEIESNAKLITIIMNSDMLTKLFLRWSSRIQTMDAAKNYIKSVVEDTNVINALGDEESNLVELKNWERQKQLIPVSWCIKDSATFARYLRNNKMFLLKYQGQLYGVNYKVNKVESIFNNANKQLEPNDPIYNIAKAEFMKKYLFSKKIENDVDKCMDEILQDDTTWRLSI